MIGGIVEKSAKISKSDMEKISRFTRKEFSEDELYIFNVTLCDNDIDRDYEKFSIQALKQMQQLFIGKTGISDHSMKSSDQKARIFDTFVEKQNGKFTADGEQLYCLKAKAYMLRNKENSALIQEIDAGIKKEVSVSCSMGSNICSICSKDRRKEKCTHINSKTYGGKLCYSILSDAKDAYEFSFVAVPAQRGAGVTKSFDIKEDFNMKDIIKTIEECDSDITISKSQASRLSSYIEDLKEEAELAGRYKDELVREVVKLFALNFPHMDTKIFSSVASVMTSKELISFRDGLKKSKNVSVPKPQLVSGTHKTEKNSYSQFKI